MNALETRLREALEGLPNVELAVLFGSRARANARSVSDVDLGVRLSDGSIEQRRMVELVLGRAVGCRVDVVDLDQSPPLLRFEIAREGKVLVERHAHAWADFRARAMLDWWDWAPIARRIHAAAVARLRDRTARGPT
ncbi:MAG TPA: nucleotidyltransferase domain-containing protein [Vicinamibacteria bacterium]|nr:nucleotidyltransferase domain-containing protein [Vicinamibacteria bacterium]